MPIEGESAIKVSEVPAIQKELPVPDRQYKEVPELPTLLGRPGRVHDDEEVNDILDTMLRDGKAPYGRARQQYNYKFHSRLAERLEHLERAGTPIHANFRTRKFWKEWSSRTSQPISTAFYRKFA